VNDTIDGIPVTKRTVRFEGELNTGATFRAGQVVPMVVLVSVGDLEHTPGHDDDYHRLDVLNVVRLASPRSAEENEYLLSVLRGESTVDPEPTNVAEAEVATELPPVDKPNPPIASPLKEIAGPSSAPVDAAVEDDDDFVLPPPPPVPEGKETRRQIVPGDPQLRNFLGE
jgi:hypothetical protein